MKREITVDGKTFQVEVAECPVGSPFTVKVNDKSREILLEQQPDQRNFTLKVDKESYIVETPGISGNAPLAVKVNNVSFKVEIRSYALKTAFSTAQPILMQTQRLSKTAVEGAVTAPMAGKIVLIKVKKGDKVKMGTVLCVLEAMKMENEIAAPKSGVVEDIMVQEGKAVNEGDALIVLK